MFIGNVSSQCFSFIFNFLFKRLGAGDEKSNTRYKKMLGFELQSVISQTISSMLGEANSLRWENKNAFMNPVTEI
jgi:hypothetical protein